MKRKSRFIMKEVTTLIKAAEKEDVRLVIVAQVARIDQPQCLTARSLLLVIAWSPSELLRPKTQYLVRPEKGRWEWR